MKAEEKAELLADAVAATARATAIASGHPDPDMFVAKVVHAHHTGELLADPDSEEQVVQG